MKIIIKHLLTLGILFFSLSSLATGYIVQAGTIGSLMQGNYTGSTTFAELETTSDLGLGTNNGLGGELVVLDGKFYLADEHGDVKRLVLTDKTPYATLAKFTPQQAFSVQHLDSLSALEQDLDKRLSSQNLFYVIKVDGEFSYLKARSIKAPNKPYLPLDQLVKTNQRVFEFNNVKGTLIMFKSPTFMSQVTVPGYHVHFISADRKKAGHVFDVKITNAKISIMETNQFDLLLPTNQEYTKSQLQAVHDDTVHAVEGIR